MDIIMPMILYVLEVMKYCLGNEIFFRGKVKQTKRIAWIGCAYFVVVLFFRNEEIFKYLLSYIFAMLAAVCTIEGNVYTKVWHTICILGITSCIEQVSGVVVGLFVQQVVIASFVEMIITLLIFFLLYVTKRSKKFYNNKEGCVSALRCIMLIIVCLAMNMGMVVLEDTYEYIPKQIGDLDIDFIFILTYSCITLLIYLVLHIRDIHIKLEERAQTEYELKIMQKNYFQTLLEKEEDTRRYRHDMNNHILCISQFAKKEQAWQTLNYVQDLQKELFLTSKNVYNTGIEILDILLNHYLVGLENKAVSVKGKCSCRLQITEVDFCIIFSNLICNAIEEIKMQSRKDDFLEIEVKQGEFYTSIKIANSSNMILNKLEIPVSKKGDRQNHGIGLKNVKETIERNDGSLELTADGKVFSAVVTLKNDRLPS